MVQDFLNIKTTIKFYPHSPALFPDVYTYSEGKEAGEKGVMLPGIWQAVEEF